MKQDWKAVGSFGTVGLEMVLSILLGLFFGRWLDGKLGTAPYLSVLWFFFGVGAAARSVHRTWKQMQAMAAREEREQGNPAPLFEAPKRRDERLEYDPPTDHDGDSDAARPPEGRDER
jgi:hypothetical protein